MIKVLDVCNREFFLKYNNFVYDHEIAEALNITTDLYVKLLKKFKAFLDSSDDDEHYFETREEAKICVKFIVEELENGSVWFNCTKWRKW